jgi:hypothetical protein
MTVQELIDQLSQLDPNQLVLVDGYEGGFTDIKSITDEKIVLKYYDDWWEGPHEALERTSEKEADINAYIINR